MSDLVRGRSALFLTELEDRIEVLDPASTVLVADASRTYNDALLYLESHRRRSIPNDDFIHLGHRAAMTLAPYQLDPALQALTQPRARILMADATGLGKTLEAGILATELIQRSRGKRVLVVALKSMLTQFQKEWWSRFSIPLVRLDSVGLARVRNRIPANHNPFNYFDRSIISIDTLKSNLEYRNYLENAWWDIIVIDECQNVAARAGDQGVSRRARLARMLATRSDTLMLLSATPHDGSARSFASLMSLLDPTAISDPDDYTPDDYQHKGLVIRRFKKDIRDQVPEEFRERATARLTEPASAEELTDSEQQDLVDRFGRLDDPVRVLLCSDVASEGLNLHYFCHRLVHFDLPWSLMVFQQRNGRVDRYGQKRQPQIIYLSTQTEVDKIGGDLRILEILQTKDEQANRNLGDPASFLNVYDPDKEAEKVASFMAQGLSPEQVEKRLDTAQEKEGDNEGDWLLKLFGGGGATAVDAAPTWSAVTTLARIQAPSSLFASDYQFAKTALTALSGNDPLAQWSADDDAKII